LPFRKWGGYEFITAVCNGHSSTANGHKCPFGSRYGWGGYVPVTAVAVGKSQRAPVYC
jgi:hypothetical protein